jgi:type II secretory ATPase GspE/PulE/Tfp pilus assembly ATPase PilB-like protein
MGLMHVMAAIDGGGYISTLKLLPAVLILLVWARLMTWADKDAEAAHLPRIPLNLSFLAGLIVAYALFFYLPGFLFGLAALILISGIETGVYLHLRSKVTGLGDLKKQFKEWLKSFKAKPAPTKAEAGKVVLIKDGKQTPIPDAESLDRPAYDAVQQALTEPLQKKADQLDLVPEDGAVAVKYWVDGFAYRGTPLERTMGADAISYLKWAASLNIDDKRKPQSGTIRSTFDGTKHEFKLQTAGTTAGEYARVLIDPKKRFDFKLDALGFTESQLKQMKELIALGQGGVILLSTPKSQGLTSLTYTILKAHDVVLQFAQSIERFWEEDLEGVTQSKLSPTASAEEERKMVSWVISQEPDVMLVDKVENPKSAAEILEAGKNGKRIYVAMRANSTFEALDQWRRLVGDNHLATESLKLVVNGRVLRKLCAACKVAYSADPATLKKLNMNPEKVEQLFQARSQPLRDPKGRPIPCEFCYDLHFKGRRGVFEFLTVDDDLRAAVDAGKPLNQPFRKQRGHYLQEEALALVEAGQTSVQEVLRVLKGGGAEQGGGGEGGGSGATPASPRRPAPVRA